MDDLGLLHKVFPNTPLSQVWVGWNDAGSGGYPGGPADSYLGRLPSCAGRYFCIGALKAGHTTRRLNDIETVNCLVLDDIGTKALDSMAIRETLGAPDWIIETSQGNYQWGWVYKEPVIRENWLRHRAVVVEAARRWGVDKAGADPNRLVRLPSGVNLKPGRDGWQVRHVS